MLRCPLCLGTLDRDSRIALFCLTHPETGRIEDRGGVDLVERLRCPKAGCTAHVGWRADALVVQHIHCPAFFPFNAFESLDLCRLPRFSAARVGAEALEINHWEMTCLQNLMGPKGPENKAADDISPMWYPASLLRSCRAPGGAWMDSGPRAPVVELCGSRQAGKTVLALQAMDREGYTPAGRHGRKFRVQDFIYLTPNGGLGSSAFFEMLAIRGCMERNESWIPPQGTPGLPINMKAIRLWPLAPVGGGARAKKSDRAFSWHDVWLVIRSFFGRGTGIKEHHDLLFYDTAGEDAESEDHPLMLALDRVADVVAVLVDGSCIWGSAPTGAPGGGGAAAASSPSSLYVARRRLERVAETKKGRPELRSCVIITKLDAAGADSDALKKLAENDSALGGVERRRILIEVLTGRGAGDTDAADLVSYLDSDCVDEVFFVWTKGAGSLALTGPGHEPRSHGMAPFVCWCLGKRVEEVFGAA
jgi:hypothetical protein